jgi:hypothetical protein
VVGGIRRSPPCSFLKPFPPKRAVRAARTDR